MSSKPDVIFFGDSHVIALNRGAKEIGLVTESAQFSGSAFHNYGIFKNRTGWVVPGARKSNMRLREMEVKYGVQEIFELDVPIITNIGYHLGRFMSPLEWTRHRVIQSPYFGKDEDENIMSNAFFSRYILDRRKPHFAMLRHINSRCNLWVVPPPRAIHVANYDPARATIMRMQKEMGLRLIQTENFVADETGFTPRSLLENDGSHGTTEYGKIVMQKLIDLGIVNRSSVSQEKAKYG